MGEVLRGNERRQRRAAGEVNDVDRWADTLQGYLDLYAEGGDDIETAVWAAMTERLTPREIAERPLDVVSLQKELATVIFRIAHSATEISRGDRNVLYSVAVALVKPDSEWLLKLGRPKAGRRRSYASEERNFELMRQLVEQVEQATGNGEQVEAAIAQAMQDFDVSRSKAYAAWRRRKAYRHWHESADKVQSVFVDPEMRPENRKGLLARLINYLSPTFPSIRE